MEIYRNLHKEREVMENELGLFIKSDKVMVSSLDVAENYGKMHKHIIRDIQNIIKDVPEVNETNFGLVNYTDKKGEKRPCYEMDRQGFSMLVMGFTGAEAKRFTYKYTKAFEKMLREREQNLFDSMSPELKAIIIQDKKIQFVETRVDKLENTMTIDYGQQDELNKLASKVIVNLLGGKKSKAYKETSKKVFSAFWRSYKDHFNVNSYKNTPVIKYKEAINYIENWIPDYNLQLEIQQANNLIFC